MNDGVILHHNLSNDKKTSQKKRDIKIELKQTKTNKKSFLAYGQTGIGEVKY